MVGNFNMPNKEKYLIHCSGGFDSCWSLMWFLDNFDENIIVHFLDYKTKNSMDVMQRKAFRSIKAYVEINYPKRVRWMVSYLNMGDVTKPIDIHVIGMFTGAIQRVNPQLEFIIKSAPIDEEERLSSNGLMRRRKRAERVAEGISGMTPLKVLEPLRTYKKKQAWEQSGEWKYLTWSCRKPSSGAPCGMCHACLMLKNEKQYELHR